MRFNELLKVSISILRYNEWFYQKYMEGIELCIHLLKVNQVLIRTWLELQVKILAKIDNKETKEYYDMLTDIMKSQSNETESSIKLFFDHLKKDES